MIGGRGVHQSPGGTTGVPGTKAFGQQVSCFAAAGKKTHLVQCQYGVQNHLERFQFSVALRPQRPHGLLETGGPTTPAPTDL